MAAKRNALERTLDKARSLLSSYVVPGRKSAEATLEELLRMLRQARSVVASERKRIRAASPRRRKRTATRPSPSARKRTARMKRRSAAAAGRPDRRTTAAKRSTAVRRKPAPAPRAPKGRKRSRS
ncbi:MAG TPA: hypothetical protein VHA77_07785 [Xanthobacteraceae bacterium]|jgi:hypothetical protein|nr:hypothetical protein [Xanthobacteraceae bacterium]